MDEASALRLLVSGHTDARALGFDDDAAVVSLTGQTVISQDMLVEDVDFRRATFSAEDIGHKALAVNLSDLAAMGAVPLGFMQAIALPPELGEAWLSGYARGVLGLATRYRCPLWGGDLSRGEKITISITAFGATDKPLRRRTAQVGDRLQVSGVLGAAAAGLALLESGEGGPAALLLAQRRPEPQVLLGERLAQTPGVRGAMDLSDGLAADLPRFLPAGFGACLEAAHLPMPSELRTDPRALRFALSGGEDFVLLAAMAPDVAVSGFTDIGSVDGTGQFRVRLPDGREAPLGAGFDHFAGRA